MSFPGHIILKKGDTVYNLDYVDSMKDLGITIDCALSFDAHIQNIVSKANRMAGLIRR